MPPFTKQSIPLLLSTRYPIHHHSISLINPFPFASSKYKPTPTKTMSSQPQFGIPMPQMIYGTAWKKDLTSSLVHQAIKSGFRAIDTAAMKRHYDEALTGQGIRQAINEGIVTRKDLWIQTKYTPQDPDFLSAGTSISAQIKASITNSLSNLSVSDDEAPYLDALILHSPFPTVSQTLEAWNEGLQPFIESKQIRYLGISNTPLFVLKALYDQGKTKPYIVQNRFRAEEYNWDLGTRKFCEEKGIKYQGFWTLTGNPEVWKRPAGFVKDVAEGAGVGVAEAWYVLMMEEGGIVVLNGTTNQERMEGDLEAGEKVKRWRETDEGKGVWERCVKEFRGLVDGE
ncbi:putative NAD(P)H-dependent D-xylose reductase [Podospora fimiseda]|uniref:NAD(P)H-dependent D-xylose reductase n=1 Tax=Podospora fimiseda TaxID=252190 RepID=A0AAN7BN84_9PEZI|nr:putative NAD(P)H-dependent D-xylose reductase [Podospora fimiseda]